MTSVSRDPAEILLIDDDLQSLATTAAILDDAGHVVFQAADRIAALRFARSQALDLVIQLVDPLTSRIGFPAAVLPMALLRPLSGSGAFAVMSEIVVANGPDSFISNLACTLQGSTETTFYVITLYFGASGTRNIRHTLVACLCGDLAGFVGATAACHAFFD